jgi:hypothetical protein
MKLLPSSRVKPFWHAIKQSLHPALAIASLFGAASSFAQTPPLVYPEVGPTTHFVNQDAVLSGFPESGWFKANIPFIDLPDKTIENTYYYRWRVAHEAEKYTGAKNGCI